MPRRHYRLRLAKPGANSLGTTGTELTFSTTGGTTAGFLTRMGSAWGGQRVKPIEGRTESLPWQAFIGESQTGEEFTQHIADAGGRADMLRRLGDVSSRPTTDSAWTSTHVQATARLTQLSPTDKVGEWRLSFIDERIVERETEIFTDARSTSGPTDLSGVDLSHGTTTTQVYPMGLTSEWAGLREAGTLTYEVHQQTTYLTWLKTVNLRREGVSNPNVPRSRLMLPGSIEQLILDDLKPDAPVMEAFLDINSQSTEGSFETLLAEVGGNNYEVISSKETGAAAGHVGAKTEHGLTVIEDLFIVTAPGTTLSIGDQTQLRLWMPTHAPDRRLPKHLGGSTGTHAVKLARQLLEDAGVKTDSTQFTALEGDASFPHVTFRETGEVRLDRWLEQNIWHPFGLVPAVNRHGELSPRKVDLPTAGDLADPDTLTQLSGDNVASHPSWQHATNEMVNELNYHYDALADISEREAQRTGGDLSEFNIGQSADLVEVNETRIRKRHDRADKFLTNSQDVKLRGVHTRQQAEAVVERHARQTFQRFGDGPVRTELDGLEALEALPEFGFVKVSVPTYPNLASASRGSTRVMQIISRRYSLQGPKVTLLDVGPASQPMSEPTVSLARSTDRPKHKLDVTLTNTGSTSNTWHLQLAESTAASAPGSGSTLWFDAKSGRGSTGSVNTSVVGRPSGQKHFGRARLTSPNRIGSSWSSADSTDTEALAALSTFSTTGVNPCSVTLKIGPGEDDYPTEVLHGTTRLALFEPTTAPSLTHEVFGLTKSSSFTLTARHVDSFGGEGPGTDVGFVTGSSNQAAPATAGLSIAFGSDTT